MKRNTILWLLRSTLAVCCIAAVVLCYTSFDASAAQSDIRALIADFDDEIVSSSDSMLNLSSNPYDYIVHNKNYTSLVSHGFAALPDIEAALADQKDNGLSTYILAIAYEEITNMDLKADSYMGRFFWDSGKKFYSRLEPYKSYLPEAVENIAEGDGTVALKAFRFRKLGALAAPYMMDIWEKASPETREAIEIAIPYVMQNNSIEKETQTVTATEMGDWSEYAEDIQIIREYLDD